MPTVPINTITHRINLAIFGNAERERWLMYASAWFRGNLRTYRRDALPHRTYISRKTCVMQRLNWHNSGSPTSTKHNHQLSLISYNSDPLSSRNQKVLDTRRSNTLSSAYSKKADERALAHIHEFSRVHGAPVQHEQAGNITRTPRTSSSAAPPANFEPELYGERPRRHIYTKSRAARQNIPGPANNNNWPGTAARRVPRDTSSAAR